MMALDRLRQISSQLTGSSSPPKGGVAALTAKHPDDIVFTMAARTPLGRQYKGQFKDVPVEELLTATFKAALAKSGVDPKVIQDVIMGNVQIDGPNYYGRAAMLAAGMSSETPIQTVERFCSSGLMAVSSISNRIKAGEIDIGLAIGFEHMSQTKPSAPGKMSDVVMCNQEAADSTMPMGWTSENVAGDYNITREEMDQLAFLSHTRASKAQQEGTFTDEIIPVEVSKRDPKTGEVVGKVLVTSDDVIRHGTTLPILLKIRSAFPQWTPSQTTGGNASQNSDGGAAVLLMRRSKAQELGLKILGKHVGTATVGVPPRVMGIGPVYAIPAVLKQVGITKEDVDLFEINEAFASQYAYCIKELGLDVEKVNVNGGAIALGHPLGATGARQVATGMAELERRKGRVLVTSMCMGTGMGAAAVFVRE